MSLRVSCPDGDRAGEGKGKAVLDAPFVVWEDRAFRAAPSKAHGRVWAVPCWPTLAAQAPGGLAHFLQQLAHFQKVVLLTLTRNKLCCVDNNLKPYVSFRISPEVTVLTSYYLNNHIEPMLWKFPKDYLMCLLRKIRMMLVSSFICHCLI